MRTILTSAAPIPTLPYPQAVVAQGMIFVSGQRPVIPETGEVATGFDRQAHRVFTNLRAILRAAGADLANVVKLSVYLSDLNEFDRLNEIYREYFQEPYPARTTIGATLRGILIEVDAIAVCEPADKAAPCEPAAT